MVSFGFLHRVVWLSFLVLDGRGWRGWEGRGKGEVGKDGEKDSVWVFSSLHVT